jgi:hypothetical protein
MAAGGRGVAAVPKPKAKAQNEALRLALDSHLVELRQSLPTAAAAAAAAAAKRPTGRKAPRSTAPPVGVVRCDGVWAQAVRERERERERELKGVCERERELDGV